VEPKPPDPRPPKNLTGITGQGGHLWPKKWNSKEKRFAQKKARKSPIKSQKLREKVK
jgi:hypothetical protein